ncbi:MAG: outer membrane protein assembly factor BamE [Gemmataceae bacterium]|nr:outer membrane protein assembly factor BamE [Gemmataceae bacterium]
MATRIGPACWRRAALGAVLMAGLGTAGWLLAEWALHLDEWRRFYAVEPGMTEDQVLAALGKPPGQYGPPGARYAVRPTYC